MISGPATRRSTTYIRFPSTWSKSTGRSYRHGQFAEPFGSVERSSQWGPALDMDVVAEGV